MHLGRRIVEWFCPMKQYYPVTSLQKGQKYLLDVCEVTVMLVEALQCLPYPQDEELPRKIDPYPNVTVI